MMEKLIDRTGFWEGSGERGSKWEAVCRIRIYEKGDRAVVVASEITDPVEYPNGTGTSISQCAEHLARLIRETFGLNPEHLTWIEQYALRSQVPSDLFSPEFSLVRFTYDSRSDRFSQPSWKYLPRTAAITFTGDNTW